jgi:hypothetical protein
MPRFPRGILYLQDEVHHQMNTRKPLLLKPGFASRSPWVFTLLIIVVTGLALSRGLGGDFIFDDFRHLQPLEEYKTDSSSTALPEYVFSTVSGTTRPLPLITFAWQADAWPDNPDHFLAVNLLLHLVNALLVFLLLRQLLGREQAWLAAIVCGLWVLSPIHIATVLYPVQRMTLLASGFMLAGLLVYLVGRRAEPERATYGRLLMLAGIGIGGCLAILSKENGVLILPLALLADWLCRQRDGIAMSGYRHLLLWTPLVLAMLGLLFIADDLANTYATRTFNAYERLLTETRVLCRYLVQILLPGTTSYGIYYDDYPVSRGLLAPITTLSSIAFLAVVTAAAVRWRHALPLASFGWFWFLICHAMESTVLPLELVFEHRNYLAAAGPILAVAVLVHAAFKRFLPEQQRLEVTTFTCMLALGISSLVTTAEAGLWGKPLSRAEAWVEDHPDSPRAQTELVHQLVRFYQPDKALSRLRMQAEVAQEPLPYRMTLYRLLCLEYGSGNHRKELANLRRQLRSDVRSSPYDTIAVNTIDNMSREHDEGKTPNCERNTLVELALALAENPHYRARRLTLLRTVLREYAKSGNRHEGDELAAELLDEYGISGTWHVLSNFHIDTHRPTQASETLKQYLATQQSLNPLRLMKEQLEMEKLRKRIEKSAMASQENRTE